MIEKIIRRREEDRGEDEKYEEFEAQLEKDAYYGKKDERNEKSLVLAVPSIEHRALQ